jgi:hypothetical protein
MQYYTPQHPTTLDPVRGMSGYCDTGRRIGSALCFLVSAQVSHPTGPKDRLSRPGFLNR